jgi:predicted RNA-binding Zn-ribbon protein involved in translation (DUF1610 family)
MTPVGQSGPKEAVIMFDSPFDYCPKCGEMVLLDQTQRECAAEHRCGDWRCPLQTVFTGIDFRIGQHEDVQHAQRKRAA